VVSRPWPAGPPGRDEQHRARAVRRHPRVSAVTRPGAPLPHAWIDDEDGRRRPVKDLVAPGRFLLIAGEDGQAWCEAARRLAAEADIPLDAVRIGHLDGDCHDPRCAWLRHPADRQRRRGPGAPGPVHRLAGPGRRQEPPGRPHRRAQPGPWAQTVGSGGRVPDRRGCCAALMAVCRQRAPGANVRKVAARTKPASSGTGGHKTADLGAHPAREQSVAAGKAARQLAPLESHRDFAAAASRDPVGLLLGQAGSRVPELVPVRHGRMLTSPFAYYRGRGAADGRRPGRYEVLRAAGAVVR
jgi:Uncharacterized protein conserved in bacteria (DUF2252)